MNQPHETSQPAYETLAIVGVGLIGGSIAAAARANGLARRIVGVGRDPGRLQAACDRGLLDHAHGDLSLAAAAADFIVFCTPVDCIAEGVRAAARASRPGTLLTDAGSVKEPICREVGRTLAAGVEFVGAHPIAGSEQSGFEAADAKLFAQRVCIVTPTSANSAPAVRAVTDFWARLGMRVATMSPAEHDGALAETSHLPHVVAAALAATVALEHGWLTATGFRDVSRVASGDPGIWTAILLQNADQVLEKLRTYQARLIEFERALGERDAARLYQILDHSRQRRNDLVRAASAIPASAAVAETNTSVEEMNHGLH